MEQLTKEQAIAFHDSKEWENWNDEQIVRFQLFQDKLVIPFDRFHKAIETVLNRPVYTHEFGMNWQGIIKEYLGVNEAPSLQEIIDLIPEEKRILIGI